MTKSPQRIVKHTKHAHLRSHLTIRKVLGRNRRFEEFFGPAHHPQGFFARLGLGRPVPLRAAATAGLPAERPGPVAPARPARPTRPALARPTHVRPVRQHTLCSRTWPGPLGLARDRLSPTRLDLRVTFASPTLCAMTASAAEHESPTSIVGAMPHTSCRSHALTARTRT
jgi:hypothetical protein